MTKRVSDIDEEIARLKLQRDRIVNSESNDIEESHRKPKSIFFRPLDQIDKKEWEKYEPLKALLLVLTMILTYCSTK